MKSTYIITLFKDVDFSEELSEQEQMEIVLKVVNDSIPVDDFDGMTIEKA